MLKGLYMPKAIWQPETINYWNNPKGRKWEECMSIRYSARVANRHSCAWTLRSQAAWHQACEGKLFGRQFWHEMAWTHEPSGCEIGNIKAKHHVKKSWGLVQYSNSLPSKRSELFGAFRLFESMLIWDLGPCWKNPILVSFFDKQMQHHATSLNLYNAHNYYDRIFSNSHSARCAGANFQTRATWWRINQCAIASKCWSLQGSLWDVAAYGSESKALLTQSEPGDDTELHSPWSMAVRSVSFKRKFSKPLAKWLEYM